MKIKILGNGGAISDGLQFNSFLIDDSILIECPPDIVRNLFLQRSEPSNIKHMYISHFHGDHCFGFPFFALRQFVDKLETQITISGSKGLENHMMKLLDVAFSLNHPVNNWVKEHYIFQEVSAADTIQLTENISIEFFEMVHLVPTLGFKTKSLNNKMQFAYFADTVWDEKLASYINDNDYIVLTDLNGEDDDVHKVHISEKDILEKIVPEVSAETFFYGTHLKNEKKSKNERIMFVTPGDEFEVR